MISWNLIIFIVICSDFKNGVGECYVLSYFVFDVSGISDHINMDNNADQLPAWGLWSVGPDSNYIRWMQLVVSADGSFVRKQ